VTLTVSRPEGQVVFTKKEVQRYTMLLTMIDTDCDEQARVLADCGGCGPTHGDLSFIPD
jgi:hypothetical protein